MANIYSREKTPKTYRVLLHKNTKHVETSKKNFSSPTFTLDTNRLPTFSVLPRVSTWKLGIPRIWQAIQVRFRQVLSLLQVDSGSKTTFNIKRDRHHIIPTSVQKNRILYTTILREFFNKLWTEFETFKGGFCYLFHPFFPKKSSANSAETRRRAARISLKTITRKQCQKRSYHNLQGSAEICVNVA